MWEVSSFTDSLQYPTLSLIQTPMEVSQCHYFSEVEMHARVVLGARKGVLFREVLILEVAVHVNIMYG